MSTPVDSRPRTCDSRDVSSPEATSTDSLVFVYNADSGVFNALADLAHKTFAPDTYACNLCKITYSPLGMRRAWRKFLDELGLTLEFLHRDEFSERHGEAKVDLPAILRRHQDDVSVLVDAETLNACRTMQDLQDCLRVALKIEG